MHCKKSPPPFIIPVFISHQGCPHRCVFCNQHSITGATTPGDRPLTAAAVKGMIDRYLSWPRRNPAGEVQVAFYGGSFTALAVERQQELLDAVRPFLAAGRVHCIRVSTRPDYVGCEEAEFLRRQGVRIVELGIQSLDPQVLAMSGRGHTVQQAKEAIVALKRTGITAGAQLMVGLPGERTAQLIAGAKRVAELKPDLVRIYPTLVVRGSGLERMYWEKRYLPQSLNQAIARTARMKEIFDHHGIPVVRMGLQPSASLEKEIIAGPYHPAYGELVLARMTFKRVRSKLAASAGKPKRRLALARADQSIFRGPRNISMQRLAALGLLENVEILFCDDVPRNTVQVTAE